MIRSITASVVIIFCAVVWWAAATYIPGALLRTTDTNPVAVLAIALLALGALTFVVGRAIAAAAWRAIDRANITAFISAATIISYAGGLIVAMGAGAALSLELAP